MKKSALVFLCLILVLATVQPAQAQTEHVNLAFTFGTLTDDSFSFNPFLWTAGLHMDIYLSETILITPEITLLAANFTFEGIQLVPGALLNLDLGGFLLGAGVVRPVGIGNNIAGTPPSDIGLKVNAGYLGEGYRLAFFFLSPFSDFFKINYFGVSIGFYFY